MENSSVIFFFSISIAVVGTIGNVLSLSYFITKIKSRSRAENTGNYTAKLFVALNVFDLFVSVVALSMFMVKLIEYESSNSKPGEFRSINTIYQIWVFATGFLTCILSVKRAINLVFPLHTINWKLVKVSVVVYCVIMTVLQLMFLIVINFKDVAKFISVSTLYQITFWILASLFVIVVLANTLCVGKIYLSHSQTVSWKRKATITVAIISAIYCICNIGFLVNIGIYLYSKAIYQSFPTTALNVFTFIFVPLNSACNPVVYLIRRADMRTYVKTLWDRLVRRRLTRVEDRNVGQHRVVTR